MHAINTFLNCVAECLWTLYENNYKSNCACALVWLPVFPFYTFKVYFLFIYYSLRLFHVYKVSQDQMFGPFRPKVCL